MMFNRDNKDIKHPERSFIDNSIIIEIKSRPLYKIDFYQINNIIHL